MAKKTPTKATKPKLTKEQKETQKKEKEVIDSILSILEEHNAGIDIMPTRQLTDMEAFAYNALKGFIQPVIKLN